MSKDFIQYYPERTQIIFFDLEFYVPECDREGRIGLKANPYRNGHFLIGGTFYRFYPLVNYPNKVVKKDFWIWDYKGSEESMLKDILSFIEESWNIITKKENQAELFFSGIGISRVDIQYLFARSHKYHLRTDEQLFNLFNKSRFLDFETIVIPYFNNKDTMLKTKSTGEIISKFKIERERGKVDSLWEQYDNKDYKPIKERNMNEVADLLTIYKTVISKIHSANIIKKYSTEVFERKCSALYDMEECEFFRLCYNNSDDDWHYLNEELTSEQIERLHLIQEKIRKE